MVGEFEQNWIWNFDNDSKSVEIRTVDKTKFSDENQKMRKDESPFDDFHVLFLRKEKDSMSFSWSNLDRSFSVSSRIVRFWETEGKFVQRIFGVGKDRRRSNKRRQFPFRLTWRSRKEREMSPWVHSSRLVDVVLKFYQFELFDLKSWKPSRWALSWVTSVKRARSDIGVTRSQHRLVTRRYLFVSSFSHFRDGD